MKGDSGLFGREKVGDSPADVPAKSAPTAMDDTQDEAAAREPPASVCLDPAPLAPAWRAPATPATACMALAAPVTQGIFQAECESLPFLQGHPRGKFASTTPAIYCDALLACAGSR